MSHRICVLGETLEKAIRLLDLLCEANQDDIYRRRRNVGIMNDGTELIAVALGNPDDLWGYMFDYVFYEDGAIGVYCALHGDAMEHLERKCLIRSVVPREFQWCAVDTHIL